MTTDTKELRRFAEKATKGPWRVEEDEDSGAGALFIASGDERYSGTYITRLSGHHDAHYIAEANPAAVLSLLDANDTLTQHLATLREALERVMEIDSPRLGNPSRTNLVEYWEYEKSQGRGIADDMLFALSALSATAPAATGQWIPVNERLPTESDGTVAVLMDDGSILTAWATYWHGSRGDFAQWTLPIDPDGAEVVGWFPVPAAPAAREGEV